MSYIFFYFFDIVHKPAFTLLQTEPFCYSDLIFPSKGLLYPRKISIHNRPQLLFFCLIKPHRYVCTIKVSLFAGAKDCGICFLYPLALANHSIRSISMEKASTITGVTGTLRCDLSCILKQLFIHVCMFIKKFSIILS